MKLEKSLKEKTITAVSWTSLEAFSRQGLRFVLGIVLARLLAPADYGLIAMVLIFTNIAGALIESGLNWALVQKKDATQTDFSTAFFFNIVVGFVFYLILFFASPFVASFYGQPQLILVLRILGLNLLLSSLSLVQHAMLSKNLDFKTKAKVSIISTFLAGTVAVILAYFNFGVWALVFQLLLSSSIDAILLYQATKWKPTLHFSYNAIKSLFNFGSKIMFANLLNSFFQDIHSLVIGKIFSPVELGLYSRGQGLSILPMKSVYGIYQKVFFPVFSKLQDEPKKLINGYKKSIQISTYILFPMMFCLASVAEPFIKVLLTEKWLGAVNYLQLFCIVSITYPLSSLSLNLIGVMGRSDLFLKLEIIKKSITGFSLAVTFSYGIKSIIIGQIISSIIGLYLNLYFVGKLNNYSVANQFMDILPTLLISSLLGIICYLVSFILMDYTFLSLIIPIPIGILFYYLISRLFKLSPYLELKQIIKPKLPLFLQNRF